MKLFDIFRAAHDTSKAKSVDMVKVITIRTWRLADLIATKNKALARAGLECLPRDYAVECRVILYHASNFMFQYTEQLFDMEEAGFDEIPEYFETKYFEKAVKYMAKLEILEQKVAAIPHKFAMTNKDKFYSFIRSRAAPKVLGPSSLRVMFI